MKNVAWAFLVAICISAVCGAGRTAAQSLPVVSTLQIVEQSGVAVDNYPMTLSLVFKQGEVPGALTVQAGGTSLTTQTDVKVHWPDGSVKHALVSFIVPYLQANATMTLNVLAGGTNANATWMSKDDLLATDFEALTAITVSGQTTNISARQLLQGIASPEYWIKGQVATEFIIRDWNVNAAGQLNVSYRVRVYPSVNAIRIDTVVENCWINARGNITYDCTLSLGKSSPQVVFSKTALAHNQSARWHKIFWQGTTPPNILVKPDIAHMISAGVLPSYDLSLTVPEVILASTYSTWLSSAHDVMNAGPVTPMFTTTGSRPDIGLYPKWAMLYLVSLDSRAREIMLNAGDESGSAPIHFRETDSGRSFYRHVISVDDRPTILTGQLTSSLTDPADRFPTAIGSTTTPWSLDLTHQPSLAYVPYLVTGDYYYLEEMYFWAAWNIGYGSLTYRQGSMGIIRDSTRGEAWAVRTAADAAAIAPDGDIEKAYLNQKVSNTVSYWMTTYAMSSPGDYPTVRFWREQTATDPSLDHNICARMTTPSDDDCMLICLSHLHDLGYPTLPLMNWLGKSILDRFSAAGWNPFRAAPYRLPTEQWDGLGGYTSYPTWAAVNNGFVDKVGPSDYANPQTTDGYDMIARAALSCVAHLPNVQTTLGWVNAHYHSLDQLGTDPRYALVPVEHVIGDVDNNDAVNLGDLKLLVASWNLNVGQSGFDAGADCDGDGAVNLADLKLLVANWNKTLD